MKDFTHRFNSILVESYHNLLLMEETKRKYSSASFSFRDRNAIAFLIRFPAGKKISDVADYLKISRPSATTLIKKLEKNGLVEKVSEPGNDRTVLVRVTKKGKRFSAYQRRYRERLARRVHEEFTNEDKEILYKGFCKLNDFFVESIEESEKKHHND